MFKSLLRKAKPAPSVESNAPDISRVVPGFDSAAPRVVPKSKSTTPTLVPAAPALATALAPEAPEPPSEAGLSDPAPVEGSGAWLVQAIADLRTVATALLDNPADDDMRKDLFLAADALREGATGRGYPVIARIAASLCTLIERAGPGDDDSALLNLHIEACRAAASGKGADASVDLAEAVCIALEDRVAARTEDWG